MADAERDLQVKVSTAVTGQSELDRYNAKLKEMADRESAAAKAAKELADEQARSERIIKAKAAAAERATIATAEEKLANEQLAKTVKRYTAEDLPQVIAKTSRLAATKQQLRAAVRGLTLQFPMLHRAMALALNPITIAVTGLVAAFSILRDKLSATGEVMKTAGWDPPKVNAVADAWERVAAAITASAGGAGALSQSLSEISSKFGMVEKLAGTDNPLLAAAIAKQRGRREAGAQSTAGANALIAARRLRQRAGGINVRGTNEQDAAILAELETEAGTAAQNIAGVDAEIDFVEGLGTVFNPFQGSFKENVMQTGQRARYLKTYGAVSREKVLEQLYAQRSGYQQFIGRRDAFASQATTNRAMRGARTAMLGRASELEAEGLSSLNAGQSTLRQSDTAYAFARFQAGQPLISSHSGAGMTTTPDAVASVRQVVALLGQLTAAMESFEARINRLNVRERSKPE